MDEYDTCRKHAGEHYQSPEFKAACEGLNWHGLWPIIDGAGNLTGKLLDSDGDPDRTHALTRDDMAAIDIDDLPMRDRLRIASEIEGGSWNGYACLPAIDGATLKG